MENKSAPLGQKKSPTGGDVAELLNADDGSHLDMIMMPCTPSKESAMGPRLQGIAPDLFDPDTGICRGNPATPEQLARLGNMVGTLSLRPVPRSDFA